MMSWMAQALVNELENRRLDEAERAIRGGTRPRYLDCVLRGHRGVRVCVWCGEALERPNPEFDAGGIEAI